MGEGQFDPRLYAGGPGWEISQTVDDRHEPHAGESPISGGASDSGIIHDDDDKWLARVSLVSLNGSLAGRAIYVAIQISLARFLGPVSFGLYAIGWSLFRVGSIFTPFGLDSGVIHCATRHASTDPVRLSKLLRTALILACLFGALIGLGLCFAAPILTHRVFGKDGLMPVIYMFAAAFPLASGLRVAAASTTVSQSLKYKVYAEQLAQPTLNLALLAVFYLLGFRLMGAVAAVVISYGGALVLAVLYQRKLCPEFSVESLGLSRSIARELLQFSTVAWLGIVFINLNRWVDRLFLGAYLVPGEVGVYQAAAQTSVLFVIVAGAFIDVAAPRIALHFRDGRMKQVQKVYGTITKWALYSSVPFFLLVFFAPKVVLRALYGSRYVNGAWPLVILSATYLIEALAGPLGTLMIFTARQKLFATLSACALVVSVILNFFLIPRFGAVGAAVASALSGSVWVLAMLVGTRLTIGLRSYDRRWYKGILAAAAASGALLLMRPMDVPSPFLGMLYTLMISATVFGAGLFMLGLDQEDRELIHAVKFRFQSLVGSV